MINAANVTSNNVSQVNAIRFDVDSGFDVVDMGGGEVKIAMNSTFKYWIVNGQQTLIAEGLDSVEFKNGTGINITTDPNSSPKSLTISSSVPSNHYVPPGGTAGQVLSKNSGSDYDTKWSTVTGSGTLTPATSSNLGGVKIGNNISVTPDGVISVDSITGNNVVSGNAVTAGNTTVRGAVRIGNNISVTPEGVVSIPVANATVAGVVSIGNNISVSPQGVISVPLGAGINKVVNIPDVSTVVEGLSPGSLLIYNTVSERWDTKTHLSAQDMDGGEY
jgi:hypothetical protein